jgi:hypothetical protein
MKLEHVNKGQRVAYVPTHAHGNLQHKDVEVGTVSSKNARFVFVKCDKQLLKFGWDGTTSQSCDPADLVAVTTDTIVKPVPLEFYDHHH